MSDLVSTVCGDHEAAIVACRTAGEESVVVIATAPQRVIEGEPGLTVTRGSGALSALDRDPSEVSTQRVALLEHSSDWPVTDFE